MALLSSKNNLTAGGFTIGGQVSVNANRNFRINTYNYEHNYIELQQLFLETAQPNTSNIVAGDKLEADKFKAVYIYDWGNDIFDNWGFFLFTTFQHKSIIFLCLIR